MSTPADRLREFVDPVPSKARPSSTRNGAILIALALLAVYAAVTHDIPLINGAPGYTVAADFRQTNQVNDRSPVRVDGVEVGIVESVEPGADPRRESRMTMRITDEDVVVHSDARATVRWKTVLGGSVYVDLEPGSEESGELGDQPIPMSRTASQVELDDVLRVYGGGTEQAQRDTLEGLAKTFGEPASAGAALEALPALETVRRGAGALRGTENGDLRRLVASTATTVDALGANVADLGSLVHGADETFGALNARRVELGESLELSPGSLDETEATMTRLRTTLDHLDPLVARLRPGARELAPAASTAQPALEEASALLREARPLLEDARPTFDDLRAASVPGAPVIEGLDPTVDRVTTEIVPWLQERDESTQLLNYQSIGPFFSVVDAAAAGYDREGYRLRLSTPAGSNTVTLPGGGTGSPATAQADLLRTCTTRGERRCASFATAFSKSLLDLAGGER